MCACVCLSLPPPQLCYNDIYSPLIQEFVKILWPDSLCEYIASQTNAYAIEEVNAYILYKHNCKREDVRPMISKCFRASIARELFSLNTLVA